MVACMSLTLDGRKAPPQNILSTFEVLHDSSMVLNDPFII